MKNTVKATLLVSASAILFGSGCAATLKHVPSSEISAIKVTAPAPKLVVADVGDERGVAPERIGSGVSYWFPYRFTARDAAGALPVSYFIADSMHQDLNHVGYSATLVNRERKPVTVDDALAAGKAAGADYVVTTKVTKGATHFWGFLFIPFFEPVWTRIGFEVGLIDMKTTGAPVTFQTYGKGTEWRFAKVTLFDAVFDAAIFGRRWHSRPWGETVVPDALAEAVKRISSEIGKSANAQ